MFKRILIATDGSELSRRAADKGLSLAKSLGVPVSAVFVVDTRALPGAHPIVPESAAPYYFSLMNELRKAGEQAVDEVAQAGAKLGVSVKHEVIEGVPGSAIVEAAKSHGADLIVMGTHGRSGFAAMLLGSTAQGVLHQAGCPVLVIR
jgi:nucleotide-binding universal stress UspA family protein